VIFNLYAYRDRKAGNYTTPFASQNDETAKRDFLIMSKKPENVYIAPDIELYGLGSVDTDTGELLGYEKPKYIIGGVENAE
jgi:hypothetical protein